MADVHTPGPWVAEERDDKWYARATYRGVRFDVARVYNSYDRALIAAAPSLLEALRLLVADVRAIGNTPPQLWTALAKADEALAMCGAKEASSEDHG